MGVRNVTEGRTVGRVSTTPNRKDTAMTQRISRRAFKRAVAERNITDSAPRPVLPDALEAMLVAYEPGDVDLDIWVRVQPALGVTMRESEIRGEASFRKHLGVVAKYLVWRAINAMPLDVPDAFNQVDIDRYYIHGLTGSERTRNDYRSRLTNIARRVNPSPDAVLLATPLGHRSVRPGYSDSEMVDIRRIAKRQKSPSIRRQLCAAVGLCAGAGLSSTDLRHLESCHVIDHGIDGIEVQIPGPNARVVWVRHDFEEFVRIGIEGLKEHQLVIGTSTSRRNIVGKVVERASLGNLESLAASRLRSTWLTWLLINPVPLATIMYASGLKSARTLTELLDALDIDPADVSVIRTGGAS